MSTVPEAAEKAVLAPETKRESRRTEALAEQRDRD